MFQLALTMYHVPADIQVVLDHHFDEFPIGFSTSDYTTNCINLKVGIDMGCTMSPIPCVMAMEVIIKIAEGSISSTNLSGGCSVTLIKVFMDGTNIIYSKQAQIWRILAGFDAVLL
ncbi:reverse transcriptase [Elysia marginata]|uniref:Reverse transcriptase n=1 Tax=Elysia marginata TaxID=1093978 RepID=A0AAV4EMI2_9GAST|nr:reverse transcriptase [Elysia marginata]